MKEHQLVTPEVADGVVRAYQDGEKLRDIELKFGVARATVYWLLEKAAVSPNRIQRGRRMVGDDQQLAQLYTLIEAQDARLQEVTEVATAAMELLGTMVGQHVEDIDTNQPLTDDWKAVRERWEALESRLHLVEDQG
jgi:hypothetical protein